LKISLPNMGLRNFVQLTPLPPRKIEIFFFFKLLDISLSIALMALNFSSFDVKLDYTSNEVRSYLSTVCMYILAQYNAYFSLQLFHVNYFPANLVKSKKVLGPTSNVLAFVNRPGSLLSTFRCKSRSPLSPRCPSLPCPPTPAT